MLRDDTPDLFLKAYHQGLFPMADNAQTHQYHFYQPERRGQLSIEKIHIPKRLLKTVKQLPYHITINTAFDAVIKACGQITKTRRETWINPPIEQNFIKLHEMGHAHSIECWENKKLVGGLYGLAIGKIFCGESMFSTARDASKIALIHLCARLWAGGFKVLDTQYTNSHLQQFGVYEIPHAQYAQLLVRYADKKADFNLKEKKENEILQQFLDHHSWVRTRSKTSSTSS